MMKSDTNFLTDLRDTFAGSPFRTLLYVAFVVGAPLAGQWFLSLAEVIPPPTLYSFAGLCAAAVMTVGIARLVRYHWPPRHESDEGNEQH